MVVKHAFTSAKSDSSDSTLVNPSNWNDTHTITGFTQSLLNAADFDFTPIAPGGNLIVGANTIPIAPMPVGLKIGQFLFITGGTGTAEGVEVTGLTSTTVIVTCANIHSGAWTIQSATGGIQEAINAIGPTTGAWDGLGTGGGRVYIPSGIYDIYGGQVLVGSNLEIFGDPDGSILKAHTPTQTVIGTAQFTIKAYLHDLTIHLNSISNACGLDINSTQDSTFNRIKIVGGAGLIGVGVILRSTGVGQAYNTAFNTLTDLHIEIGPSRPVIFQGFDPVTGGVVTENLILKARIAGGDSGHPMIEFVQGCDSNTLDGVDLSSSLSPMGVGVGSSNLTLNMGTGGQKIYGLTCEGTNTGYGVFVAYADEITIRDLRSYWTNAYYFSSLATNCIADNVIFNGPSYASTTGFRLGSANDATFLAIPRTDVTLVNGLNSNINVGKGSFGRIAGPTGAFSIGGFIGGIEGRIMTILNSTAQTMTIINVDTSSTAVNRIQTLTGANVVLRAVGPSSATFIYSAADSSTWILIATN